MRDTLPKTPRQTECAVVNLDSNINVGTHWTAYYKNGNDVHYFDSFGNLKPPTELIDYLKNCNIVYNHGNFQDFDDINCGHLCLKFLYNKSFAR